MELSNAIMARRSIRKYKDELVAREMIDEIVTAGMWAPTACNKQCYRFIYIEDKAVIGGIVDLGTAHFVKNCNQAILVLYDNRIDNLEYRDDLLSAGAVTQNMLLKAAELGVGTCWVCNLPVKKALKKLLDVPSYYNPIGLVTLGYPVVTPKTMPRKRKLEEVLFVNKFDHSKEQADQVSGVKLFVRKQLRKIYIRIPKNGIIFRMVDKFEKKFDN